MRSVIPTVRKNGIVAHGMKLIMIILASVAFGFLTPIDACHGIATQSSISISFTTGILSLNLLPSPGSTFGKSANSPVTISTDNFTGYVFSVSTPTSTSLTGSNGGTIPTISSAIDETTFSTSSTYVNQWGFKPSQYVTTNNNVDTVVQNSNFLPAPSSEGMTIAKTSSANATGTSNTYNLAFGAKVDNTLPAGTYTTTYVLTVLANSIVYNITYNANNAGTVTNMPSPNPQPISIDGGTPADQSYGTLSSNIPILAEKTFGGWCDVQTTYNSVTQNDECSGTTYAAGANYPIDQTADGTNITLYAIWLKDPFPMVWNQMGKCIFDGANNTNNGYISGINCADYSQDKYIDTGVALYSTANYNKDYEVHFTIDRYVYNEQPDSQSTIFNDKLSSSVTGSPYGGKSPGIVVRKASTSSSFEIKSTYTTTPLDGTKTVVKTGTNAFAGTDVRIYRINSVIYVSIDNGPLEEIQDMTDPVFNQQFGLTAWFGAYPDNVNCTENCTQAKRYFEGELSNMYIKLGDFDEANLHTVTFNGNNGTPATTTYMVMDGDSITNFPTVTRTDWTFGGWWTAAEGGTEVTTPLTPTTDVPLYAHWYKAVSQAEIVNDDIQLATGETETINITNGSLLEPYTLVSGDNNVATVNQTTGVVTAVGPGTTTITMTGSITGDTKIITVSVGTLITVSFDPDYGTESVITRNVADGGTMSASYIPQPTRNGYELEGWYTGHNGTGTKLTTSTIFGGSTPTYYYANWTEMVYVCKIATTRHSETCQQASGYGCRKAGWSDSALIEYGYLIQDDSPVTHGAAYDCDVDYDGVYDDETERFYYFGTENGNAKLVHYINLHNNASVAYDVAITYLPNYELDQQNPSTPVWDNPYLVRHTSGDYAGKAARFMSYTEISNGLWSGGSGKIKPSDSQSVYLFENTNFATANTTDGVWLEKSANNGKNRIQTSSLTLTHDGNTSANAARATIEVPVEYMEPYYEPPETYEITFEPHNNNESSSFTVEVVAGQALGSNYPSSDPTYTDHVFQGWYTGETGGTLITDQTVPTGDNTYHAQWIGTVALAQVGSSTMNLVEGNTGTITITNSADIETFTFSSSNSSIATVDSSTGVVTGLADGTAYITITGDDSHTTNQIVTVTVFDPSTTYQVTFDPRNGDSTSSASIQVGNAIGSNNIPATPTYTNHVFQRWYDVATGNTVTSATEVFGIMTVYAEWKLDVQQAIISNSDLTVPVDGQITILVSNAAEIEPYTFSSSDSTIATVDSTTGVITGVSEGTTNIIMTGASGLTKTLEVDVLPAPAVQYQVTFNTNGGTLDGGASSTRYVEDGTAVGSLPTASKTDYKFFGWYTDNNTFYNEVYPTQTVTADVTYYAKWVEDTASLPIVWSEINACTFNGSSNMTGNYCTQNMSRSYIDTGIALYNTTNYNRDYEIGFTIVSFTPLVSQETIFNEKYEGTLPEGNYPGIMMRSSGTTNLELAQTISGTKRTAQVPTIESVHTVKIVRQNGIVKYSYDGANMRDLQDMNNLAPQTFDTTTWFGSSATTSNTPMRQSHSTLTDMYIRLSGSASEYTIRFDTGGGSFSDPNETGIRRVTANTAIGTLPTVTPPGANYTFDAWYDESVTPAVAISSSTLASGSKTYVAHYNYQSSDNPVTFDVSNNATRAYKTLINSWVQGSEDISTFHKDTNTINDSTWGDTTVMTEQEYWEEIQDLFYDNNCLVPSYADTPRQASDTPIVVNKTKWTSGSVDCSKPDAYDTFIRSSLNVYLYDTVNQTVGSQVTYADADNGIIHNLIPGQTYKWVKDGDSTVYGYVTVTSNGSSTGTRWVDTGNIRNVRDLGGLPVTYTDSNNQTVTGTLAYGRLFRGERLWSNSATELTKLGINKEYDVGTPSEYPNDTQLSDYRNDEIIHYNFAYHTGDEDTTNGLTNYMRAWLAVTHIMEDITNSNNPKNIYFHCRIGSDRTGTIAYLLEGLLGVPDEERYEEYSLTYLSGQYDRTRYYKQKSDSNNLKFVFMLGYVKTNADIYNWYMQNPNADASLIQSFRAAMTVPTANQQQNSPQNNQQQSLSPVNSLDKEEEETEQPAVEPVVSESKKSSSNDYASPLGVSEETTGTAEDTEPYSESSSLDGVVVAAAAVIAATGVSYALAKNLNDNDKEEQ